MVMYSIMFKKFVKLTVVILIGLQIIHYFYVKHTAPNWVIERLETRNCSGYETLGMSLPLSVLFNTETIGTVYLKHKEYSHSVDLEIQIIDTGIPLLKGIIDFRLRIKSKEIRENFSHCYEFKNA